MSTIETSTIDLQLTDEAFVIDDAQVAAVAFLARYNGRTLDAYRHDLRGFFQWAVDNSLAVLAVTRPHIELYRSWMEDRGLAASTIDRRLSTVCGFYRFAHIDGRIASNPPQYVRRPQVHPSTRRGLDRSELGVFLFTAEHYDRAHAALAVFLGLNGLRVSEACATNVEDLAIERGHRTLRIFGKGSKPATIPLVPRTARTPSTSPSANAAKARSCDAMMGSVLTAEPRTAGVRSIGAAPSATAIASLGPGSTVARCAPW